MYNDSHHRRHLSNQQTAQDIQPKLVSLLQRWNIFVQTMETKDFLEFEIIINVLVSKCLN